MTLTFREQMMDFPVKQMLVVSLMRFSEPLAFTSLFPYLYFMIRDFHIAPTEEEISKYSGYLASSFAFCQFIFAVQWGKMLDRIGRKPVLLCGLLGTSASLIMFGFSTNYYMALAARSIAGMLNGNIAVLRTVIGEICHDRKHQALGFSTLPLLFNFGSVIGPLIGGLRLFTNPKQRSPYNGGESLVNSMPDLVSLGFSEKYFAFRDRHPYALSNIVVSTFLCCSCLIGFLFLEETNEKFASRRDYGLDLGDTITCLIFGGEKKHRPWRHGPDEETPLLSDGGSMQSPKASPTEGASDHLEEDPFEDEEEDVEGIGTVMSKDLANAIVRTNSRSSARSVIPPKRLTPQVITVIAANCIISLHSIAYTEFLPVLLAAQFRKNDLHFPFGIVGGFGLESSYIGTLFSSTGIVGMLIVLIIFPWIDRTFGTLPGFRLSLCFFPLVYAAVPLAIFTLHDYNSKFPVWLTPILLYLLTSLKTLASATGLPQVMILNHRAAAKPHRAYVNSLTMSMLAFARFLGPIVFGYLMALGDRHHIGWLSWWIMAVLALFGLMQSFLMSDYED